MNNPIPDSILDRIQKLLALAGNNPDENEVDAAMRKANELLAKHNLSIADLDARADQKSQAGTRTEKTVKAGFYTWQKMVWKWVAEMNFCYLLVTATYVPTKNGKWKREQQVMIIGREHNILATIEMGKYVVQAIEDMSLEWVGGDNSQRLSRECMSWKKGCSDRVNRRIRDIIAERQRAEQEGLSTSDCTALVKFDQDETKANHAYVQENHNPKQTKLSTQTVNGAAYNAGQRAGDRIGLNTQVGGGSGSQLPR